MSPKTARVIGWAGVLLAVALFLATEIIGFVTNPASLPPGIWPPVYDVLLLALLPFSIIGVLIVSRQPTNSVGWVCLAIGLVVAINAIAIRYSAYSVFGASPPSSAGRWVTWIVQWAWVPADMLFIVFLPLLFPDGRLVSARWRPIVWITVFSSAIVVAAAGLDPVMAVGTPGPSCVWSASVPGPCYRLSSPFPLHLPAPVLSLAIGVSGTIYFLMVLAALSSLTVRFRGGTREERQQLKWFMTAIGLLGISLGTLFVLGTLLHITVVVVWLLATAALVTVPLAIGVAILKYRLYDIDVVLSKTILFGTMAIFITGVYVAIVVGAGALVGSGDKPNLALSILATAIVAVAFGPVREAVQRLANRLVYGKRATPYDVMTEFSDRAAASLSAEEVLPRMAETTGRGVGAVRSRVRLFLPDGGERSIGWPELAADGAFERNFPVIYRGESIGEISVGKPPGEPLTPAEVQLLSDLAAQAGLVLRNVRLTVELQARLEESSARAAELRAARHRLVTAGNVARSQLERNIQAATEPHLLSIADQLGGARHLIQRDPTQAASVLNQLTAEANETLDLMRDLARGIYPPLLVDKGLVAALQGHLKKAGIPVQLDAGRDFTMARFDQQVEAALYFCCLEALQNVVEHAAAAPTVVRLSAHDGRVEFSIADSGPGFDQRHRQPGLGLQAMTDRVRALGGTLEVRSAPGAGTTIVGRMPATTLDAIPVPV